MLLEADWVLPMSGPPLRAAAVLVSQGRIVAVGPAAQLRARQGERTVRGFPGCVLMPGLINSHSHLEYSAFHGFSRSSGFGEWMLRLLLARRRLAAEDYAVSARWGARECARAGMTCLADTSYEGWTSARAAGEAGLRGRIYLEVFGLDDEDLARTMERMEERLAALRAACGPLIEPGLSPHAPYTVSSRLYREVGGGARRNGIRVATHVAESRSEVRLLQSGGGAIAAAYRAAHLWKGRYWSPPGMSPIAFLDHSEALGPEMLAVHCVEASDDDVAILARSGVAVAHCPRSNRRLRCGMAPVAELRAAGVNVGLGTDGLASNEGFDLFAEMRAAIRMSRTRAERAPTLSAPPLDETQVLRMATVEGAAALGLQDLVGALEPGKAADIVAVRLPGRPPDRAEDFSDPTAFLVSAASAADVMMTMVDGVTVYEPSGPRPDDRLDGELAAVRRRLGVTAASF